MPKTIGIFLDEAGFGSEKEFTIQIHIVEDLCKSESCGGEDGIDYSSLSRIVNGWRQPNAREKAKLLKALGRKKFQHAFPERNDESLKQERKQGEARRRKEAGLPPGFSSNRKGIDSSPVRRYCSGQKKRWFEFPIQHNLHNADSLSDYLQQWHHRMRIDEADRKAKPLN